MSEYRIFVCGVTPAGIELEFSMEVDRANRTTDMLRKATEDLAAYAKNNVQRMQAAVFINPDGMRLKDTDFASSSEGDSLVMVVTVPWASGAPKLVYEDIQEILAENGYL